MYSRNRMAGSEERYTENLPPVYNGNRFSYARREHGVAPTPPSDPPEREEDVVTEIPQEIPEEEIPHEEGIHKESSPSPPPTGGILAGLGQEELLLIALLLLLSAEHERSMDVIVILLLLVGIH